ncbi:hypothetical protein EGW08_009690 [Elysia chlorotica]|uniref:RRM domain-containing protein n=1 Tax=Elysia chlorotica TaxID=188477 RepID=A0A433TLV2_ELYCH|nr:hypothetical protein EGW08_009690 [Elysia chlorotica]
MASEENGTPAEVIDELGSSFLETEEGGNGTLDITTETNPSQTVSQTDNSTCGKANDTEEGVDNIEGLEDAELGQDDAEEEEGDEALLDADVTAPEEGVEEEKNDPSTGKDSTTTSEKDDAKKKEDQEEEEDAEETEEAEKKMAEKFDPNQMPQVNVATLATRKWQIKVYPLRPTDFMSGQIAKVFKQAKESLLYLYTAGNNGKFSNGKAELYVSTISQAAKVMHNLIKMEFFHPETNIKIIRRNDAGAVVEKAYMRFDTKMTSLLCQPTGPQRRVGTKRERIIGSVFLKNLPDGATKDMLRVMFPFAAEINFNPEKFKDSTARLVLSNRNGVIPCLKAFSKVELGGNILELRPLEKRSRPDEVPKKTQSADKSEKPKEDDKVSAPAKETGKFQAKKEDPKQPAEKDSVKKGATNEAGDTSQKDIRKPGPPPKRVDPKRGRGAAAKTPQNNSRFGTVAKKFPQNRFGQQRWQDRQGGPSTARRGGLRNTGRGSGFVSGGRSRFDSSGGGFRAGVSPGRMQMGGMGGRSDMVNAEVTKEMIQLQAQLNNAIKNQMSMLSQTQIALEQAKRDAALSTAAAAAAAINNTNSGGSMGFSRGANSTQDQYGRVAEQNRRGQMDTTNRQQQRTPNRNRPRDNRRDNFGARGSARDTRGSYSGGKRNSMRAGFSTDDYEDVSYPKRSNLAVTRSWAEESEHLDAYRNNSSASYGAGTYRDEVADYTDDSAYDNVYNARSGSNRLYGGTSFGNSARNLDYSGSSYDYGY